jgi:ABC-2 type transport system ATP-binding protein
VTALEVENVGFRYGARTALSAVSFRLEEGQFCALLGPNGAGKSTLFSILARLNDIQAGRVTIADCDLAAQPLKALAQVGIVFQQPTLDLDMTVQRNMMYFAALHGLHGARARRKIEQALSLLGMAERSTEKVRTLNGGHRRRMEIARALIHEPKLLLLDEPTVGLDAETRRAITDHVHNLAASGLSVLWATHLVDEVDDGDRVIVLHEGQVRADATAADLAGNRSLVDAYLELTGAAETSL